MENEKESWYTLPQLKAISGISRPKIYRMIKNGKLRAINIGSGSERASWRVKKSDWEAFLASKASIKIGTEV